jgi:hypothetical protein
MLGFLLKVVGGTVKLGVKYIIVPAIVSVAITVAAEMLAQSIREHTPEPPEQNGTVRRRPAKKALAA